jgi:hypothetical protein
MEPGALYSQAKWMKDSRCIYRILKRGDVNNFMSYGTFAFDWKNQINTEMSLINIIGCVNYRKLRECKLNSVEV